MNVRKAVKKVGFYLGISVLCGVSVLLIFEGQAALAAYLKAHLEANRSIP